MQFPESKILFPYKFVFVSFCSYPEQFLISKADEYLQSSLISYIYTPG